MNIAGNHLPLNNNQIISIQKHSVKDMILLIKNIIETLSPCLCKIKSKNMEKDIKNIKDIQQRLQQSLINQNGITRIENIINNLKFILQFIDRNEGILSMHFRNKFQAFYKLNYILNNENSEIKINSLDIFDKTIKPICDQLNSEINNTKETISNISSNIEEIQKRIKQIYETQNQIMLKTINDIIECKNDENIECFFKIYEQDIMILIQQRQMEDPKNKLLDYYMSESDFLELKKKTLDQKIQLDKILNNFSIINKGIKNITIDFKSDIVSNVQKFYNYIEILQNYNSKSEIKEFLENPKYDYINIQFKAIDVYSQIFNECGENELIDFSKKRIESLFYENPETKKDELSKRQRKNQNKKLKNNKIGI